MTTAHQPQEVELRLSDGKPAVLVREGEEWAVIDMPTPIGPRDEAIAYVTHPPSAWSGWRFTARSEGGEVLSFDVRARGRSWDEIRCYR